MNDTTEAADVPEVAVVVVDHRGEAYFVMGRGPYIECDIDAGLAAHECGPVYVAPEGKGLWIWEGNPGWAGSTNPEYDEGGEPVYENRGAWRRPTPEEASRIVSGDFDLFGPPRLGEDAEVKTDADLFAGLTAHVEPEVKP